MTPQIPLESGDLSTARTDTLDFHGEGTRFVASAQNKFESPYPLMYGQGHHQELMTVNSASLDASCDHPQSS